MERLLKYVQSTKTAGFLLAIFGIFAVLQSTASCNSELARSVTRVVQRDTSVAAFIQQYLGSNNSKAVALYFPNSVKRFYDANNGETAWVKEGATKIFMTWIKALKWHCIIPPRH
jgi:hypothetical protein